MITSQSNSVLESWTLADDFPVLITLWREADYSRIANYSPSTVRSIYWP